MSGFLNHTPKQPSSSNKASRSTGNTPKKWNIFRSSSSSSSSTSNRTPPPAPPLFGSASSPSLPIHKEHQITTSYIPPVTPSSNEYVGTGAGAGSGSSQDYFQHYASPRSNSINSSPYHPRTTSIPRSTTSNSTLNTLTTPTDTATVSDVPPKVKPFYQSSSASASGLAAVNSQSLSKSAGIPSTSSSSSTSRKRSLINKRCCFCDELLSTTIGVEKVIHLKCGDTAHEECLYLMLNNESEGAVGIDNLQKLFPSCGSCGKLAIPNEETVLNEITSRYLTRSPVNHQYDRHGTSISPPPRLYSSVPQIDLHIGQSTRARATVSQSDWDKFQSLSLHDSKNSKDLSITIPGSNTPKPYRDSLPPPAASTIVSNFQPPHNSASLTTSTASMSNHNNTFNNKAKSRGSSVSAISSIISSVPKTPSPTMSSFSNSTSSNGFPNAQIDGVLNEADLDFTGLREKFIGHLLTVLRFSEVDHATLKTFGELRLVDKLLISTSDDNTQFSNFLVYLFRNNLVLLSLDWKKFRNVEIPRKIIKIVTLNQSTVKVNIPGRGKDDLNGSVIFIQNSKSNILSKWITAFCDPDISFDDRNLSATIAPNDKMFNEKKPTMRDLDLNVIAETSFEGQNVLPSDSSRPQQQLPVQSQLQGATKKNEKVISSFSKQQQAQAPKSTTFIKTANLTVVLNLKFPLSSNKKNQTTIVNILKVLQMKYTTLHIVYCINGKAVSHGTDIDTIMKKKKKGNGIDDSEDEDIKSMIFSNGEIQDSSLLLLTDVKSQLIPTLNELSQFKNQLHLFVNESNYMVQSADQTTTITTGSWDNVMELIISKFQLQFELDSDMEDHIDSDGDEFDSDAYEHEHELEQGLENETRDDGYDVKDEISSLSSMETKSQDPEQEEEYSYDHRDEISSLSGSDDEVEGEGDVEDESYDVRDEISSLSGSSDTAGDAGAGADSSSVYDQTRSDAGAIGNRWSSLLKDIDTALSETTTN